MNTERHLDPPDFETVEEILEGCFTLQEAQEFVMCHNYIKWYSSDTCDEDLTPGAEAWFKTCIEHNSQILSDIRSNCQDDDLPYNDIIEYLMHVGK